MLSTAENFGISTGQILKWVARDLVSHVRQNGDEAALTPYGSMGPFKFSLPCAFPLKKNHLYKLSIFQTIILFGHHFVLLIIIFQVYLRICISYGREKRIA